MILPDVLAPGMRVVFCGTAPGAASARARAYYAGPGNRFWVTLHEVGLTPILLRPDEFARLPEFGVGLLHGKMKPDEKNAVMDDFKQNRVQILVSTTVVEVGVDVSNATVICVDHAERFGLSQLHQLRGRVGRGSFASFCFFFTGTSGSEATQARLEVLEETNDGFEIARRDLDIRGPGEFLGARQSGEAMLRFADLTQRSCELVQ